MGRVKPIAGLDWALTSEAVDEIAAYAQQQAREDFWKYRIYIRPGMLMGWFQEDLARELQQFYFAMLRGERPALVLMAPPQHGKTVTVGDFITWASGQNPDLRTIYTSYSDDLGVRVNSMIQRIMLAKQFQEVFKQTRINESGAFAGARYKRTTSLIEFIDRLGSFYNTTVNGQITGLGLDFGVIDDPLKGSEQAHSLTVRNKVWDWLVGDFFSRFSEYAGFIILMTRWHQDDPVGRFLERYPKARVLQYKAIATEDEQYRLAGQPLFPEHKSLEFLLERKKLESQSQWEALYQQSPITPGGMLFPVEQFKIGKHVVNENQIRRTVRYWDKAGSHGAGAYSVGVLMHEMKDGTSYIEDVVRGQWDAFTREARIKQTAEADNSERIVETWVEQEPGSGGKESAERTIRNLRGYTVKADKVTGSKEIRAEPYASQVQGGNVTLKAAGWNRAFIDEHETFPNGKYKDQVDAAAGAFNKLTVRSSNYDASLSWVGNPFGY